MISLESGLRGGTGPTLVGTGFTDGPCGRAGWGRADGAPGFAEAGFTGDGFVGDGLWTWAAAGLAAARF
jgi:hypothetical protein